MGQNPRSSYLVNAEAMSAGHPVPAILLAALLAAPGVAAAEMAVANFFAGTPGTRSYEGLSLWVTDDPGKPRRIDYRYGKDRKDIELAYLGSEPSQKSSAFTARFPDGRVFRISVRKTTLRVQGPSYAKTFRWEYEGPVDGIGTFCSVCVEEKVSVPFVKAKFAR